MTRSLGLRTKVKQEFTFASRNEPMTKAPRVDDNRNPSIGDHRLLP
jgi:hypothetical protein